MNSTGWTTLDGRQLQDLAMQERYNMVIDDSQLKQFDEVFGSHHYNEADLSEFERAAEQRWQEFTGGVK